jgi:DNA-binding response OmpR family regulator
MNFAEEKGRGPMETCHILVVEDDPSINKLLCTIASDGGYDCRPAFSGSEAAMLAQQYTYDLILLDLMLPGLTGEELIARLRRGKTMPIIVLSAKAGLEDRVNVLKLGADDFIPKPFDNAEVLARIEAQLRRYKKFSAGEATGTLQLGDLVLDRESVTVTAAGKALSLTVREFEILALLMGHPKKVYTREQIYRQVWGEEFMGDDNTVNVHISNLRSKLAKASPTEYIKTVWGVGFKMSDPFS